MLWAVLKFAAGHDEGANAVAGRDMANRATMIDER